MDRTTRSGKDSRDQGNAAHDQQRALDARERVRAQRARQDYLDSLAGRRTPGGDITSGGNAGGSTPNLDRSQFRPSSGRGASSTSGTSGGGGLITPGSSNDRHLGGHNHHGGRYDNGWHCGSPWSNFYWNWNVWGWGYGWTWCPSLWATTYWWDSYWYYGGTWSYGYRPSFYYYGPMTQPEYQVIIQVAEEPLVQEVAPAPQVGEAIAPPVEGGGVAGPVVVPKINRASEYYLTLGDRAFQAGRYSDAVHHYGKAVEYAPGEGILYLILSDALFATGDYHYGAFALRKAFELDPALVDTMVNKRSFYGIPSDLDLQLTRARTFVLQNPGDMDAHLMLIANELFTGQPARALELLEDPKNREVRNSTEGNLLMERARLLAQPLPQVEGTAPTSDQGPIFEVDPVH